MRIVFRADSSQAIGSGHVMRCLTLARALREEGAEALFVCRQHEGNLTDFIEKQGFATARLPVLETLAQPATMHRHWLGAEPVADAAATLEAMRQAGFDADWIIVDHYALDAVWESAVRREGRRIMIIDDLADRAHDCDVLLDQNLVADFTTRYNALVPKDAVKLLGPQYALLQPEYAALRASAAPRQSPPRRILVYFGAADHTSLSGLTLAAFLALGRDDIQLELVVGSINPHAPALRAAARGHQNVRLHEQLPSLAELMLQADLAIGAGGATSWERLCLKLPSIVIVLADNQAAIATELQRRGLAMVLGDATAVDMPMLRGAIAAHLHGTARRQGVDGSHLVDGRGVDRVCTTLTTSRATPLEVSPVSAVDEDLLLEWANDPQTRANAFNPEPITPEGHRRWLSQRLAQPDRYRLYIVKTIKGIPIGQVRFDSRGDLWVISYAVAPQLRGLGLGKTVLAAAIDEFSGSVPEAMLVGEVVERNVASRKVFRSLGFGEQRCNGTWRYARPASRDRA